MRWWGEMVNVLWERGDAAASMGLEDLFDQLGKKHDIAIFCSFLMDNFDGEVHAHMLPRLGRTTRILFRSKTMHAWSARWPMRCAKPLVPTRPACLKVGCSHNIKRRSTCRARRRCCWPCARSCLQLPIPSCNGAAALYRFRGDR